MAVPTLPEEVALTLRKLGQPIKIFGEAPADVRERLRSHVAQLEMEGETDVLRDILHREDSYQTENKASNETGNKDEVVYTVATENLVKARRVIAEFSFFKTPRRLSRLKRRRNNENYASEEDKAANEIYKGLKKLSINVSAVGDDRPVSTVRISPQGSIVATASWTGSIKIWDIDGLNLISTLGKHSDRATGLAWQPCAQNNEPLLASAGSDNNAYIWKIGEEKGKSECSPHVKLIGHQDRLARIDFHPCGRYIGTAGFDHTWRLWDVETGEQLLLQDGHIKEVYAISFQGDGSLVATGDFGGVVRFWDLRSGKTIHSFCGHVKRVTCSDFSPVGYELVTGSDDHTVRFWDLRKRGCAYTLPAHSSLISDARFSKSGEVLVTSSFDRSVRMWNTRNFAMVKELIGHEGSISGCDISPNEDKIVSCSLDRTVKLWTQIETN
eukprot:CAMPEP_0171467112 /NCGR_PEP_ID=MMETSP0945-20130129/9735_1 /TAXON_ID=109269 /ORGANISM="Vaucheria litorea, Strain CCMP2940" /LENGTH=440 /DNA_ID=CAMNT_0011995483 /DNA_START=240 /DNA_END=1562 /DNA_ORIENTATION=-